MKTDDIKADLKSQVKDYEEGTRESSLETYTDCFGAIDYLKLQQVLQNDLTRAEKRSQSKKRTTAVKNGQKHHISTNQGWKRRQKRNL